MRAPARVHQTAPMSDVPALDDALLDRLRGFSSPTIANAIERLKVRPRGEGYADGSVPCRFPALGRTVGYAATVRLGSTQERTGTTFYDLLAHVAEQHRPTVLVAQDLDDPPGRGTAWGEVNSTMLGAFGCIGIVTNGAVRDLAEVEAAGFQMFSGSVCVGHGAIRIIDAGTPVEVAGLTVAPGDLLHADAHGVVAVPLDVAGQLPDAAAAIEAQERQIIAACRQGPLTLDELKQALAELT